MKSKIRTNDYIRISFFSTLICISSYIIIPIPFSPVPVTAQSLAVMLTGSLLAPGHAFLTVFLFILLGFIGLPVFAGGGAGPGVLFGPTGGYLIGFLAGAMIISFLRGKNPGILQYGAANLIGGLFTVYAIGVPFLALATGMSLKSAFFAGVIPFITGDLMKVIMSTMIAWKLSGILRLNKSSVLLQ